MSRRLDHIIAVGRTELAQTVSGARRRSTPLAIEPAGPAAAGNAGQGRLSHGGPAVPGASATAMREPTPVASPPALPAPSSAVLSVPLTISPSSRLDTGTTSPSTSSTESAVRPAGGHLLRSDPGHPGPDAGPDAGHSTRERAGQLAHPAARQGQGPGSTPAARPVLPQAAIEASVATGSHAPARAGEAAPPSRHSGLLARAQAGAWIDEHSPRTTHVAAASSGSAIDERSESRVSIDARRRGAAAATLSTLRGSQTEPAASRGSVQIVRPPDRQSARGADQASVRAADQVAMRAADEVAMRAAAAPRSSATAGGPASAGPSHTLVIEQLDVRIIAEKAPAPRAPARPAMPGRTASPLGAWRPSVRRYLGRS